LEVAVKKMHLQLNQGKTKYMTVTKKICTDGPPHLEIGSYKFETVFSKEVMPLKVTSLSQF
jgi:hypothetical protein